MIIRFIGLTLLFFQGEIMTNKIQTPPVAKQIPYSFEMHGIKVEDNYAWMRAQGWPDKITDEQVISHLEAENKYYNNFMEPRAVLKEKLFEELKGRIKLTDQSTYVKKDDYYYYTRTEEGKEYSIHCRKKGSIDAPEEILLDVNEIASGKKFTSLGALSVSPDHKLLAYSVNFTGGEKYTIKIMDIETRNYLPDEIENTIGSIVWLENQKGFFYMPTDEKWRHNKVKFHQLGDMSVQDKIIFEEEDPLYSVNAYKSSSKEFIFINVGGHDSNEIYFIKMDDPGFEPTLIKARKDRVRYSVDHNAEYFYMYTNDEAKNFRIVRAPIENFNEQSMWDIYIPENKEKYLSSFDITKDYLLLNYNFKGLPEAKIKNLKSEIEKTVAFPDSAYTASIYSTNFIENDVRITYSSFARPATVYSYDFDADKLSILKNQEIPSGFDPELYQVERIFVKSDEVEVPVSLFYKKSEFKKDGTNPLYLYGYGSYGISIPPSFKSTAVSLVDRGFVYAVAHIRGGDDLGHDWYEAAKFLTKKRSFTDFINVADELIKQKYSSRGNIVAVGGSAGGLLVGNVVNERPELFKSIIMHVPFVDVLNTMLDENLPLTPGEYKEWGDPKEKEYFEYMKSYSPYDNIKPQAYPAMLITAGLSDPRVGYWEAAKWVARLREVKTDDNIIIFKTNMEFGHQGASGRFDYLKEIAEDLVFILNVFNIEK